MMYIREKLMQKKADSSIEKWIKDLISQCTKGKTQMSTKKGKGPVFILKKCKLKLQCLATMQPQNSQN